MKPGVKYRDVGDVIQKHVEAHGLSVVRSYCGHGIHRYAHIVDMVFTGMLVLWTWYSQVCLYGGHDIYM